MSLLQTKSLTIGYHQPGKSDKILQQDINVKINAGEIISLMGQNGVGKTTFVKTISGLLPKISGQISYNNQPLELLSAVKLAKILSVVLTEKPYAQNLSVIELLAIARHPYSNWLGILSSKDKEIIDWAITETNINYLANHRLYELSDGQMQKVMIARALAQETDLIFLDEPAAHLDLYNKIEVMTLLRKIAKQGKGILISTHDMQISTQLSDQLWLFNFNAIVTTGTPEDLILNGALEKTLFLDGYGYDMIYGTISHALNDQKSVSIEGPEIEKFWTTQALKRNGFMIADNAELKISISAKKWSFFQKNSEIVCNSINELLLSLEKLY